TSTEIIEATRMVPARSAATARSLKALPPGTVVSVGRGHWLGRAVRRGPHPAAAVLTLACVAVGGRASRYASPRSTPEPRSNGSLGPCGEAEADPLLRRLAQLDPPDRAEG